MIYYISTHTPLAGRDPSLDYLDGWLYDFNSHAPCGARLSSIMVSPMTFLFQLTRPLRGATFLRISEH